MYKMAALIMGILLYLFISVIIADLLYVFTYLSLKIYGITALAITFIISVYGIINARIIRTSKRTIGIRGLLQEIKLVHLSDIHLGHFRGENFLQKVVDITNRQNADVVFITGDLFDGRINLMIETIAPLQQLKSPAFFIEGNHDKYSGVEEIKSLVQRTGVRALENKMVNWNGIQIIGLNHMAADSQTYNVHTSGTPCTIESTLSKLSPDKNKPTILLHHSPDGIQYASQHGVDLYLAGHTHAGQLFPINYIAELIFSYNKGLHKFINTTIFVSQGVGTFGPPMRVGTKSEIAVINLIPQK